MKFVPNVYPVPPMAVRAIISAPEDGPPLDSAWPPPSPGTPEARRSFDLGARRDPLGDRVHWVMAIVAMALQPVHPIPAAIGQAVVIVYAFMRLHATWRGALPLLRSPLVLVSLLIPLWTAIAITWSPDPTVGLEDLVPLRFALFALALWPLRDRAWSLLLALAAGCAFQAFVQLAMFVGLVPNLAARYEAWQQTGGLGKHPGNASLFAATLLPLLLGRMLVNPRRRATSVILFVLGAASVVLAGNRTHFLVVPVALVIVVLRVVVTRRFLRERWRTTLAAGVVGLLLLAAVPVVAPKALVTDRLDALIGEVERAVVDGKYQSSGGKRLYWWLETMPVIAQAPVLGHGTGSTKSAMRDHLTASRGADEAERFVTDNPHSTLLSEGIERGLVGILLWVGLAVFGLVGARRVSNLEPWLTGLPAAWLILIGYGLSSSVQLSGINTAVLAILLFLTLPSPVVSSITPSGGDET